MWLTDDQQHLWRAYLAMSGRLQLTLRGTDETLTVSRLYAGRFKSL